MMQSGDITDYLVDDTVFYMINKQFISLDPDEIKNNNQILFKIIENLTSLMQKQNDLFNKIFQKIVWVGSYYKKTRVGQPKEYDVNLVINLPIKEENMKFISDSPGYVQICMNWDNSLEKLPIYREMKTFIDIVNDHSYLNQKKFRAWMEGILDKISHSTSRCNEIVLDNVSEDIKIRKRKSGPAFTLSVHINSKIIDIDLVPVLAFHPPLNCSKFFNPKNFSNNRRCFAVPKPLDNSKDNFRNPQWHWRLSFYEYEKDILSKENNGRAKLIIRHLKKFRDTQGWKSIASYYIETLCLHELKIFQNCKNGEKSCTFLFFTMLQKLYDAFHDQNINSYWIENLNLLDNIGDAELRNMEGRLNNIIKDIKKNIRNNKFIIARYVLNETEFKELAIGQLETEETNAQISELNSEHSNQSDQRCVII